MYQKKSQLDFKSEDTTEILELKSGPYDKNKLFTPRGKHIVIMTLSAGS